MTTLFPDTIIDQPFPSDQTTIEQVQPASASQTQLSPTVTPPRSFPEPVIAQHTIGDSLDTQSRRIKGTFKLDKSGGIQIGQQQNGISGEVDITPSGISAVNENNETTFAIDANTGDATFMGNLQAGSLIAGDSDIIIGKGNNGGGRIVIFNNGLPSIVIGDPS